MMRNIYFELSKRKKLKIIPLIGMLVFPYFLHIPECVALSDSEIALSLHWPEATFYQGDIQNLTVTLSGTSNNLINITWIGIHFAWMVEDGFFKLDLMDKPVQISKQISSKFNIFFIIPIDAPVGQNDYYLSIKYMENISNTWIEKEWLSQNNIIYIHDIYEKIYQDNYLKIKNDLQTSDGYHFENEHSLRTLHQAENLFNTSISLSETKKWKKACTNLVASSNLIEQANYYEYIHWNTKVKKAINDAQVITEKSQSFWSPAAKKTYNEAMSKLNASKTNSKTESISNLKTAFVYAQESLSLVKKSRYNEIIFKILLVCTTGTTVTLFMFTRARKKRKKKNKNTPIARK